MQALYILYGLAALAWTIYAVFMQFKCFPAANPIANILAAIVTGISWPLSLAAAILNRKMWRKRD